MARAPRRKPAADPTIPPSEQPEVTPETTAVPVPVLPKDPPRGIPVDTGHPFGICITQN